MFDSILIGAVVGAVVGGLAALVWALLQPARKCPDCGTPLPKFRKPKNRRQRLWGGWTCPECGLEVDKWGNPADPEQLLDADEAGARFEDRPKKSRRLSNTRPNTRSSSDRTHRGDHRD